MYKFIDKTVKAFALAFFYSVMQSFDERIGAIETSLERLQTLRTQFHQLFLAFDAAYRQSLKSQLTEVVKNLDKLRDSYAWVMEHVAILWDNKLEENELSVHGRRVLQVFRDFKFRTTEALVAENAKIENMEQRFADPTLAADLEALGLTELNTRLISTTAQIKQLISQRNEENSAIITGEVKRTRAALEAFYAQMIAYLNAVQELTPEAGISQAAQFYNEDFKKVELQIAQSKKKGTGGKTSGRNNNSSSSNSSNGSSGDNTGSSTGDNTGTNTGDNTGSNTSDPSTGGNGGTTPDPGTGGGTTPDPGTGGDSGGGDDEGGNGPIGDAE